MGPENSQVAELLDMSILETLATLGERRGKDLLGQLFGLFQEQGPKGFATIRQALESGNATEIKSMAHSLKGSYRSLGTPRLAELSRQMEEKGSTGRLDGGAELLAELELCFEHTQKALGDFLATKTVATGDAD